MRLGTQTFFLLFFCVKERGWWPIGFVGYLRCSCPLVIKKIYLEITFLAGSTMKYLLATLTLVFSASAYSDCERIEVQTNIYEYRNYGYQIRCSCDEGDDLISGGCYTNHSGNLYTNTPSRSGNKWVWHCDSRDNDGFARQAVHLKLFCRKSAK
jgi:hypothetical protein